MDRALKHWMIAIQEGFKRSNGTKQLYLDGHATKIDYTKALRANEAYLDEIKSDQRDEAAAFNDRYRYYQASGSITKWKMENTKLEYDKLYLTI